MRNDAAIRDFLAFYADGYSGGAKAQDQRFRAYSVRLDSVGERELADVLDGIMADTRVEKLPSLASVVHRLKVGGSSEAQLIEENLDCPRGCRRGEVVLVDKDGYDFIAPCDCKAGKQARGTKVHRTASVLNGQDLYYVERRHVRDVVDYANEGIGPADIAPPLTPQQREWVRTRTETVGLPAAAKEFVEAMAKHRASASIESERTADEREKQADHAQRQTRDW